MKINNNYQLNHINHSLKHNFSLLNVAHFVHTCLISNICYTCIDWNILYLFAYVLWWKTILIHSLHVAWLCDCYRHRRHRVDKKVQNKVDSNGFIPKPPPFIHDLTKQDRQNNNLQHHQSVAVQTTTTTATVHVPKQQTTGSIKINLQIWPINVLALDFYHWIWFTFALSLSAFFLLLPLKQISMKERNRPIRQHKMRLVWPVIAEKQWTMNWRKY